LSGVPPPVRVAFLRATDDYGRRLSRLRWRRALGAAAEAEVEVSSSGPAREVFAPEEDWVVVLDSTALPLFSGPPRVPRGGVASAEALAVSAERAAHTLREIEAAGADAFEPLPAAPPAALAFSTESIPAREGETVGQFLSRLLDAALRASAPGFRALALSDPFEHERPEVTRFFKPPIAHLLDVGCGAGLAALALKKKFPGLAATGIERDAGAAERARARLENVLAEDALAGMARLLAAGETFDAFLFADVLEHLEDPHAALAQARALAVHGARLVASVPNAGHLSLIRDLLLGRFDPVPAGLADAGHLRWFTRRSLEEALGETGWTIEAVHALSGAPPPDARTFEGLFSDWPGLDAASLATYQWVVVAKSGPDLSNRL
jgi:2-polyprenyl-3-methyl-5-hydroxy-6-metoxy-1,4-benzoquinol methylase